MLAKGRMFLVGSCFDRLAVIFSLAFLVFSATAVASTPPAPSPLSYEELTTLYDEDGLPNDLNKKLSTLLSTPFVSNAFPRRARSRLKSTRELGPYLRVALWNIERGVEYKAVAAALGNRRAFTRLIDSEEFPPGSEKRKKLMEQVSELQRADVIILNEVDWGVKRSGYRYVARDLARTLRMNYAFGVQFVELSPVHLSRAKKSGKAEENEALKVIEVDPKRYKGLHGLAILSKFPLKNVRLEQFDHQPYDWFKSEKRGPSILEKGKREVSEEVFLEKTLREVRRGGRTTLYADIEDKRFPNERVTIVATHLENRSKPKGREKQLRQILGNVYPIKNPVVVAGDMNTSGKDLRPTSIERELTKRFGSSKFWLRKGVSYALGFGLVEDVFLKGISFGRTQGDPTVKNVPLFSPNPERKFFSALEKFRFEDGGSFDFRGDRDRSYGRESGTFANSNQRASKGFETTYQVKRPIGMIGKFKLDWIFVKPYDLSEPDEDDDSYRFAPHFGRTLEYINNATPERMSDHRPLIVDLPLQEPAIGEEIP